LATNKPARFLTSDRLALFPDSTRIRNDSLTIAGQSLTRLAGEHGTPLYVYDGATLDASVAAYKGALRAHYPAASGITYAGKAFLCRAVAQWTQKHKLWVDCTGEGEIGIAVSGGVRRESLLVHGVNKSAADLKSAVRNAGTIVVDNLGELRHLTELFQASKRRFPDLWLRLQPGLAVKTHHAHTQTGQQDSKFGMTPGEIVEAAGICRVNALPLKGLHFHQGSQFRDPGPVLPAIGLALDLTQEIGLGDSWHLCPGGGWGVAYHEDELPQPDIEEYVRLIAGEVVRECEKRKLALPTLHLEPGRSLVARAGVALYRVGGVKRRGGRTWLLADGGMADNPRHALYGARYSCLPAEGLGREAAEEVSIAGPYCESGDVAIEGLPMPEIREGELLAIPVSGAYHLSMSSNYNGARRPAAVWLEAGRARLILRRETVKDLARRDSSIPNSG
jgi:diaminopimelate decarboxylase